MATFRKYNKPDKYYLEKWAQYRENILNTTPVDLNETETQKKARIQKLEQNNEAWFAYYFPNFYTAQPAPFHIKASKRVLENPEWFEVRAWARELAKSARTMMEVLKLAITGKKNNILIVSATLETAQNLLLPYKTILEVNQRIINDYGKQEGNRKWEANNFITRKNVSFKAIGAGQSPRGTRNEANRPDVIVIDDIDTDEEVRNPKRIDKKIEWVNQALYYTRSASTPLLLIACGNIIAKKTTITELGEKADCFDIVNIRNRNGKSTWPQKNSEQQIDRMINSTSFRSSQKELFNNPISEGTVFENIVYGKTPKISSCERVVVYADPSTSNKDKATASKGTSYKAIVVVGVKKLHYYIYWTRVEQANIETFINWLYEADRFLQDNEVQNAKIWVENNSLQDIFYEQILKPSINERGMKTNYFLPVLPDTRRKPDKFERIEYLLDPLNRNGMLVFDEKIKQTPDMQRLEEQMLDVAPESKNMDGPDALEGAIYKLQKEATPMHTKYVVGKRTRFR